MAQTQNNQSQPSYLEKVLQELLQNGYGNFGKSQGVNYNQAVQAQMAAKDPRYAAGALLGKLGNAWLQKLLSNYIKKQTQLGDPNGETNTNLTQNEVNKYVNSSLTANQGLPSLPMQNQPWDNWRNEAIESALPIDRDALQKNFLNKSALDRRLEEEYNNYPEVLYPFYRG